MQKKTVVEKRLLYWEQVHEKLQEAYIALIEGGVQSYTINDRTLRRWDIPDIEKLMKNAEEKIDELTALLNGKRPRKAFGIIPRDH